MACIVVPHSLIHTTHATNGKNERKEKYTLAVFIYLLLFISHLWPMYGRYEYVCRIMHLSTEWCGNSLINLTQLITTECIYDSRLICVPYVYTIVVVVRWCFIAFWKKAAGDANELMNFSTYQSQALWPFASSVDANIIFFLCFSSQVSPNITNEGLCSSELYTENYISLWTIILK